MVLASAGARVGTHRSSNQAESLDKLWQSNNKSLFQREFSRIFAFEKW
jgi:hypothetical protein